MPIPDNVYFNPQRGQESFRKRTDIPDLGPWDPMARNVSSPRDALYNFINNQNVRLAYEREPSGFRQLVNPNEKGSQPLKQEIDVCNPQ